MKVLKPTSSADTAITTERLRIEPLSIDDKYFIRELVNTPGWLTFIGNRNVSTITEAEQYVNRILENPACRYHVVKLKRSGEPAGIITFIQRHYLEHPDIGFAFMPEYNGMGYAYEAASAVLEKLLEKPGNNNILATTLPENTRSVKLLEKLGLNFHKEIVVENQTLKVYSLQHHKKG